MNENNKNEKKLNEKITNFQRHIGEDRRSFYFTSPLRIGYREAKYNVDHSCIRYLVIQMIS